MKLQNGVADGVTGVAIYARVSTDDKRQTPDNQLLQLRAWCARMGYPVVREYVEHENGGKGAEYRKQLAAMFTGAARREFDLLLVWSLDRFSREGVLETLHHLQRLAQYGVGYRSFTEQYLDSCGIFKDAVLSILATIAKQEHIRLSERVHAGLAKARREGRVGGRPRLVLNHARMMRLDEEGYSIREIADEMGISPASVHRFLRSHRKSPHLELP